MSPEEREQDRLIAECIAEQNDEPAPSFVPNRSPTYLGDGVYASYDGYHVVLAADGNVIYLDDYVQDALTSYIQRVKGAY